MRATDPAFSLAWTLLLGIAIGCAKPDPDRSPGDTASTPSDTASSSPSDTSEPASPGPKGDEALVRALLAGERSIGEVMAEIPWSGGFPVATESGTYLFVHGYEGGSWSLAGSFNDWDPEPMTAGSGFWWAEVEIGGPSGQQYKFVNHGVEWHADPFARSYTYDAFGEISFVAPPVDAPRLDRWPAFAAEGLDPRTVRVYVPPGGGPWPVLYAQDGQNLFDPEGIWGGWRLQDALADLEPMLVVGIDNTAARVDEYTHVADVYGAVSSAGLGEAYAALVHEHLRPHVEQVYGSTGHDGVMGSSLGGLISLYIAHRYPGEYEFAASLSGTLGWGAYTDAGAPMVALYESAGPRQTALFLDSGGGPGPDGACLDLDGDGYPEDDPDSSDNYCVTRHFADAMADLGYTWNQDLWHWHEPGAPHNEAAWAARVHRPLGLFLSLAE